MFVGGVLGVYSFSSRAKQSPAGGCLLAGEDAGGGIAEGYAEDDGEEAGEGGFVLGDAAGEAGSEDPGEERGKAGGVHGDEASAVGSDDGGGGHHHQGRGEGAAGFWSVDESQGGHGGDSSRLGPMGGGAGDEQGAGQRESGGKGAPAFVSAGKSAGDRDAGP